MKPKIRPIAMRCTQEQFDSIKDRINLPITDNEFDLEKYSYLTNNYNGNDKIGIGAVYPTYMPVSCQVSETFDADMFLEACGVEVEKTWFGSEMQRQSVDTGE